MNVAHALIFTYCAISQYIAYGDWSQRFWVISFLPGPGTCEAGPHVEQRPRRCVLHSLGGSGNGLLLIVRLSLHNIRLHCPGLIALQQETDSSVSDTFIPTHTLSHTHTHSPVTPESPSAITAVLHHAYTLPRTRRLHADV